MRTKDMMKKKTGKAAMILLGIMTAAVFSFTPAAMDTASAAGNDPSGVRLYKATKNTVTFKWNGTSESGWQVAFRDTKTKKWRYATKRATSKKYRVNPYKTKVYQFKVKSKAKGSSWSYTVKAKANRGKIRNITKVRITTKNKLTVGKTYRLTSKAYVGKKTATKKNAYKYKWRKWTVMGNSSVAVKKGNKIVAKSPGTVTVKVRTISGYTEKKKITVKEQDLMKVDANKLSTATVNKLHVQAINKERKKAGVKPVVIDEELNKIAMMKAKDMYYNNYFDHDSPTLGTHLELITQYYTAKTYWSSENIAKIYSSSNITNSINEVVSSWMKSAGHRQTILEKVYNRVGVAQYKGYWVQEFVCTDENNKDGNGIIDVTDTEPDENGNITIE